MQRKRPLTGVAKPKLTEQEVREIKMVFKRAEKERRKLGRKEIAKGIKLRLAEKYGVSIYAIHHIRMGERWGWLKV